MEGLLTTDACTMPTAERPLLDALAARAEGLCAGR
jgi:hypothetical protein